MSRAKNRPVKKIFVIAGEASGDILGGSLIRDLKAKHPNADIRGIGGIQMTAQGLDSLFDMTELSLMGIAEIIPHIPKLLHRIKETAQKIEAFKPDLLITIDAPDFCFRVVKRLHKGGYKTSNPKSKFVHYVAPTVWAWRPKRAKKVAALYDSMLCLLPFEPPYFQAENMTAEFVGHPVMQSGLTQGSGAQFRQNHDIPFSAEVLGVFLGSRTGELKRSGVVFMEVAKRWQKAAPNRYLIVPTLPHLRSFFEAQNWSDTNAQNWIIFDDAALKPGAFAAMDVALAKSGTTGLELAVCNVPHIIGYRAAPISVAIARRLITVKYAHLVNLMLDEPIVPEFLQENCTVERLWDGLQNIDATSQQQAFQTAANMLVSDKTAAQAALAILE